MKEVYNIMRGHGWVDYENRLHTPVDKEVKEDLYLSLPRWFRQGLFG